MPRANIQDWLHLLLIESEIWHAGLFICKNCAIDTTITDNSLQNNILNLLALRIYRLTQGLYDTIDHIFPQVFWAAGFFFSLLV